MARLFLPPLVPPCQRGEAKCGATGVCVGCGRPNGSLVSTPLGPPVSTGGGKMRRDWRMCGLRATQWLACFYPPRSPHRHGGRQNAARLAYVWAAGDSQSRPYGSGFCREFRKRPASPHDDGGTRGVGGRLTESPLRIGVLPGVSQEASLPHAYGGTEGGLPPPMPMGGPRGVGGRLAESPLRIGIMP